MKIRYISFATLFALLGISTGITAQPPQTATMSTDVKPAKSIHEIERYTPKKNEKVVREDLPKALAAPSQHSEKAEYLYPGILVNVGGVWEGGDHLLNIKNTIGVYVSINAPENEDIQITSQQIKDQVEKRFHEANIKPETLVTPGSPPLPAFQIQIFVYPIDKGYVAYCSGRLFESVVLDRFKMDSNMAFQAITWEKQRLLVTPKELFSEQLTLVIQDIAQTFAERFEVYERIKRSNYSRK